MPTFWHFGFKRYLFVVVDAFDLLRLIDVDASLFELALLLELGESPCFFEFLLSDFASRFLTFCVCQSRPALLKHLFFILVHVDWIRS